MFQIGDVLNSSELTTIREALADRNLFEDGRKTAGWAAKAVKDNLQASQSELERNLIRKVESALLAHPTFVAAARPRNLVRTRFSRYEPGMAYGWHTDDAIIEGARTDLSFTVFLNEPDTYEGGELIIDSTEGQSEVKLPAGHAFLYPATTLHRVKDVTSGVRLVAFGWVRSLVRRHDQREILFDLDIATRTVFER
ncbi:MAG: Fe2+-dependent dioxygenase, partial [Alphaproteobacteria bacterium]